VVDARLRSIYAAISLVLAALAAPTSVAAHVIVDPPDSPAGVTQLYTIAVPSEKNQDTVRVEVQFPRTLVVLQLEAPAGWTVKAETDGSGRILGAMWDGGATHASEFAAFRVLAQNPNDSADLAWTAIQTYADGSEVQWFGPETSQFPGTVTRVRGSGLELSPPLVLGILALVTALAALAFSFAAFWRTRRQQQESVRVGLRHPAQRVQA
jgi:uncharacterized protein YcnI